MNIEELEDKHGNIPLESLNFDEFYYKLHTKLSIEFAISVLEEFIFNKRHSSTFEFTGDIINKIKELKQYLNE